MKTRVIVWAIVGLVVVAGVVFILTTSGRTPTVRKTLEMLQAQGTEVAKDLDQVVQEAESLRQNLPQGPNVAPLFARFDSLRSTAEKALQTIETTEDPKQAGRSLTEGRKATSEARQVFKKIRRTLFPRR
jgi:hypothetical protein